MSAAAVYHDFDDDNSRKEAAARGRVLSGHHHHHHRYRNHHGQEAILAIERGDRRESGWDSSSDVGNSSSNFPRRVVESDIIDVEMVEGTYRTFIISVHFEVLVR